MYVTIYSTPSINSTYCLYLYTHYIISCGTCSGRGQLPCEVCLSRGQLKCYIKLTVSWKTHRDEEIVERTDLPDELIKTAEGVVALQDQQIRVSVTGSDGTLP